MPDFEFEFNQQDKELIISQEVGTFGDTDYIRLTIYPSEAIDNIVTLPGTDKQALFFSSLATSSFEINVSPFGAGLDEIDIISVGGDENHFKIYKNPDESIYIKPNEIFNEYELPQGDYRIQIDFLNQVAPTESHYNFIIKQISTSRKEVRLKILDDTILNNSPVITKLTDEFNDNRIVETETDGEVDEVETNPPLESDNETPNPNYKYQFKHILNIGTGDHVPIMNYAFDAVTDGKDNQSIILKLYEPLPTNVGNLSMVTIEREVLTTQIQDIFYFSDVPDVFFGDGLSPQPQSDWINPDGNDVEFQNLDEIAISSSIGDIEVDSLISSSEYGYPNLNTDFNEFENHTFFGSAKKKLQNFKTKVETIQGYYSDISGSLSANGVAIAGDSTFIVQKRKDLFDKINQEVKTFTPYERFLYYDGQQESTASAPGLGKNYAHTDPVDKEDDYKQLNQYDGFNVIYKHSSLGSGASQWIKLLDRTYLAHDKPFFNYSGSIYLSFLLKGTDDVSIENINEQRTATVNGLGYPLPNDTKYKNDILKPNMTGSAYQRYVFQTSHSYWIPNTDNNDIADLIYNDGDFNAGSTNIQILSGSIKTGSYKMSDTTGFYPTTMVTQSGVPFWGSVMPAGDLFKIKHPPQTGEVTQSFMTDVRVTLKDPSDVYPFDNLFKTSSGDWTTWYNNALTTAENFDTNNIHSFENNLPEYIRESSEYSEMKDFLNLQGEQYDLIRNHIDSVGTIHKRGYKKTNSPPKNTLPMLLSNMGWQAINPFTGSLTDTLGSYLSGVTSIDDIKNNTWRKTLNNLLYIYKSKGTKNSVRALLNTYGYPPDVLEFQEFGGVVESSNNGGDNPLNDDNPPERRYTEDTNLDLSTGSFNFTTKKEKFYRYIFNGKQDRILNLDWWMDSANINTFEFVYKHAETTQTQTILESSGSGAETLWDLRLVPSSRGISSSFQFRLNNSKTGSLAIASNAVSMSTAYSNMTDGQLWNVMLQRITSSTSTNITNEYRLHTAFQNNKTIGTYNYVTMSVSGAAATDSNNIANQNWMSSGSRHQDSSSNLFVGEILTGSLGEIRGWDTALSTSKFRQHTFNKFSTTSNTLLSHCNGLVYHFKLNENYSSSSVSASNQKLTIVDSAPKCCSLLTTDYSFQKTGSMFTGSFIYGLDIIDSVKLTLQDNTDKENDNTIFINPNNSIVGNLNPNQSAALSLTDKSNGKPKLNTSPKLELYRSPQNFVNDFIISKIGGFNLEKKYGNPLNFYSQSYDELDTFRTDFFNCYDVKTDINKFIRSHESMFNHSLSEGLKNLVPARSTFSDKNSNFGVEIKPTILEKQKYENEEHSVETNPNTFTASISSGPDLTLSEFIQPKSGSVSVNVTNISTYELPKSASISVNVTNTTTYELPKSGSITMLPSTLTNGSTVVFPKSGSIDYASRANESFVNIHDNWGTSSNDTHFINHFDTGSDGNSNTYHIDTRFVFHAVGDHEYYSASFGVGSTDFTNSNRFFNRLIIDTDFHSSVNYDGKNFGTGSGIVTGKMMGKTRYFTTGSDNNIILPSNHVTKFSNPFTEQMVNGTQNITNSGSGFLNVRYEDYSSASFYRVKVTGGQTQIRVQSGNPGISPSDKIIYDDNNDGIL